MENTMLRPLHFRPLTSFRSTVAIEEESVWIAFYRRVGDPAVAAEVIEHLDGNADLKRTHAALYLSCKESLRKAKARVARRKRVRGMLRRLLHAMVPDDKNRRRTPPPHAGRLSLEAIPPAHGRDAAATPVHEPQFEAPSQPCAKAA